jgi:hypothetical protein
MSMIGGKSGSQQSGGMKASNQGASLIEAYEDFRNYVRNVAQDSGSDMLPSDSVASTNALELSVESEDYYQAYVASAKMKKILGHYFIDELIKAGKTWQAEFGNDEQSIIENDPSVGLEAFFISTGENLLVRKRGFFGIVYYFGWYETKPLIMRTINLLEFGKTSEGYQVVNTDFNQTKEAILEYLDIQ